MEENPLPSSQNDGSDVEIEYDEDGNPLPPPKKRYIDPLPPIDHSEIVYEPFEKNFYTLHEDIVSLSMEKVEDLKKALGIKVHSVDTMNIYLYCQLTDFRYAFSILFADYRCWAATSRN